MIFNLKSGIAFKRWLKTGIIAGLFIILLFTFIGWQLVRPASRGESYKQVTILSGTSVNEISEQLKLEGLIHSKFWFESWVWLTNKEARIVSGYYSLPANVNIINLTRLLSRSNQASNEVKIRIIEGWTINQMADYLESIHLITSEDFIDVVSDDYSIKQITQQVTSDLFESLPATATLQGYLFPDTYQVYLNAKASDIAVRMVNNLDIKLSKDWRENIKSRGLTIHEAITLASIVEKEVPGSEDRKIVADIFLKRLESNIGLQADSTINYITGKNDPAAKAIDLTLDSLYNTYKYRGLPPGPISNPGLTALEAVASPIPNDYWYFLTTPDGKVIYSKTYSEHLIAKNKYLR